METAPAKSQPLHNFSLPQLKWANKSNHGSSSASHRFRRHDSPSPELNHPDGGGESEDNVSTTTKLQTGPRTARSHHHHHDHRFSFSPCSSKQQKPQGNENAVVSDRDHTEDKEPTWNLRPRKQMYFGTETLPFGESERIERSNKNNESRSMRLRGGNGEGTGLGSGSGSGLLGSERKTMEKRKLWISLSKEEIEEDVYAWTGTRPSRRPKKRSKTIQKQLDNVFPGLYMVGATVDFFKVHDAQK